MKVRNIPAQITTVEDKIVGNLNLTQILLLIVPVFWLMIVYTLFAPSMHFAWYKVPAFLFIALVSLSLAIRIKEKLVLNWLVILLRYNLRPKYYVFNKNDQMLRDMDIISFEKAKRKAISKSTTKVKKQNIHLPASLGDIIRLEGILANPDFSLSIKSKKKGAFHVAIEQKQ